MSTLISEPQSVIPEKLNAKSDNAPIVLCEPVCRGIEHATFNAALVTAVYAAYYPAPLHFYGEATHLQAVRGALTPTIESHIVWHSLVVPPRQRFSPLRRLPQEVRFWRRLLGQAANLEAACFIGCSCTAASIMALKWLLPRSRYNGRVLILLHSLLAEIARRRRNPLAHVLSLRRILAYGNQERLRYVVMSDVSRDEVCARMPKLCPYFHVLPFPYQFYAGAPKILPGDRPLRFGFFGVSSWEKGFDWFARLATDIGAKFPGRAEFHLIGELRLPLTSEAQSSIICHATNGMLPRAAFDALAATMDYSILLHDPDFYRLLPSGTIMDAFLFGLPLIARRSSASPYYFETMGDIGYLIDDYEQLQERVATIIQHPPSAQYAAQSARIIETRERYAPEALAATLRSIVDL